MLDKPKLKQDLKAMFDNMASRTENPEQSRADLADQMSELFDAYVRSAQLTVSIGGIMVSTAGSAAAQTGQNTNLVTVNIQ